MQEKQLARNGVSSQPLFLAYIALATQSLQQQIPFFWRYAPFGYHA
jgi:hypothetical protein